LLNFKTWLASDDFKRGLVGEEGSCGAGERGVGLVAFTKAYPVIKYYNKEENFVCGYNWTACHSDQWSNQSKRALEVSLREVARK
jgi:hypothetical protein